MLSDFTKLDLTVYMYTCRYFGAARDLPGVRELFQQHGEQSVVVCVYRRINVTYHP